MDSVFRSADGLGPEKVVHLHNPATGLQAIVVVDNTALGPAIGGVRMARDAGLDECLRLARAMTLKNAAAGLPHGGAKSVIRADPALPAAQKEDLLRSFAQALRDVRDYVPGPDMGLDEAAMAWIRDEGGRAVGLPSVLGGIPLDEIGATGYGLAIAAQVAEELGVLRLNGARVVLQGFGAVGRNAARFLAGRGAILVAVADVESAVANPDGLDVGALAAHTATGAPVGEFAGGTRLAGNDLTGIACDIWIPAARPDAIDAASVERLDCRLFLEGANIPASPEVEARMAARGITVVPDIVANSGGVICAAAEYAGLDRSAAFRRIEEKLSENTGLVLRAAMTEGVLPRRAAEDLARARLHQAMRLRRWAR